MDNIARAMIANGISAAKAAKVLGLTPSAVKKICGITNDIGNVPPFGWVRTSGEIKRDEAEQRVLTLIHELRAGGMSVRAIVAHLEAHGVQARGARWHKTTVQRILSRL